eukprot:7074116-Prymnesium_polylepis.2
MHRRAHRPSFIDLLARAEVRGACGLRSAIRDRPETASRYLSSYIGTAETLKAVCVPLVASLATPKSSFTCVTCHVACTGGR